MHFRYCWPNPTDLFNTANNTATQAPTFKAQLGLNPYFLPATVNYSPVLSLIQTVSCWMKSSETPLLLRGMNSSFLSLHSHKSIYTKLINFALLDGLHHLFFTNCSAQFQFISLTQLRPRSAATPHSSAGLPAAHRSYTWCLRHLSVLHLHVNYVCQTKTSLN